MLSNAFSRFFESVAKVRTILAPHWRRLIVLSLMFVGLAVFCLAEVGVAKLIVSGQYFVLAGALVGLTVIFVTFASPFWGYSIWFFLSCYLSLFSAMLPAMFSFDLLMLALLSLVLTLSKLYKRESLRRLSIEEVFLILYFIYAYVIRREFNSSHMVAEMKYLFMSPLAFYFIAKSIIREKKHIYWLMVLIIAAGFSWALMGIYEQITGKMWLAALAGGDRGLYAGIRSAGPAGFYYLYGNMLILSILLCVHLLGWLQKSSSKLLILGVCLITAVGLYYGYSRSPYIAFLLTLIIMLMMAKRTRKMYAAGVGILFLAAVVIVPFVSSNNVLRDRFTAPVDVRLAINVTSRNMFKANYMFGVGTNKYGTYVQDYVHRGHLVSKNPTSGINNDYTTSHSEYYNKLCELGIVGFVLYFGMYALFLYRIVRIRAKLSNKDIVGHDFASLACAFTAAVLFTMITDQFAINQFMYAIIFLVFAMVRKAEFFAKQDAIESTGMPIASISR